MPEPTTETKPAKKSFIEILNEGRPANEHEAKARAAAEAAQPKKSDEAKIPNAELHSDVHQSISGAGIREPSPEGRAPIAKDSAGTAATPDPDEEILTGKRNPKGDDFKRVKTAAAAAAKERDEARGKLGEFEKELTELRKAPKHNAELIKTLEKERDELKQKWEAVAAQFDPGFNAKYQAKVDVAVAALKPLLPADRAEKIAALLQQPESEWKRKAMAELIEDLDSFTVGELAVANRDIRAIMAERQAELGRANEVLTKSAEERQKKAQAHAEAVQKAFEAELSRRQEKDGKDAIPVFQLREGDSDDVKQWNAGVQERSKVAKAIFEERFESASEKAEAAIWAAAAPGFLAQLKAVQSENASLKDTLAKLQAASPSVSGGGDEAPAKPERGGFMQKVVADMAL